LLAQTSLNSKGHPQLNRPAANLKCMSNNSRCCRSTIFTL
jgi:hypothetical protein